MKRIGYQLVSDTTPIIPVLLGDERLADRFSLVLQRSGYHVDAVKFPGVGKGKATLRFIMNAGHTQKQIDGLLTVLESEAKTFLGLAANIHKIDL